MKLFATILTLFVSTLIFAQDCETIVKDCEKLLNDSDGKPLYISDGQVYTAFLDRESAEFTTTFYGGSTYRIATSGGSKDDYVIFTVRDEQGNILFTNRNQKNAPYWDFEVPKTINLTIETQLDPDKKVTGCVVMLIGFKQ